MHLTLSLIRRPLVLELGLVMNVMLRVGMLCVSVVFLVR